MFNSSPLTRIEISKENLLYNFSYLQSLNRKISIAPVLKSNAYGHGLVRIAKALDSLNSPFFCVNSFEEAILLNKAKTKTPTLIMGYCDPSRIPKNYQFSFTVYDFVHLKLFIKYYPSAKLHLFIDTGMHREGILIEKINDVTRFIKINHIKFEGLMSHFACGDKPNAQITKLQIANFKKAQRISKENEIKPKWVHIAASSALLRYHEYPDLGNMARVGLALYGFDPGGLQTKLRPALKLISKLIQIKRIKKGEYIGYGRTYRAKGEMTIGILPLGYNEGLDWRLSNCGFVSINKTFCPIIGRVSMNITTVDIGDVQGSFIGQEVVVYSDKSKDLNSIENSSKNCKTIPHNLLSGLSPVIQRAVL